MKRQSNFSRILREIAEEEGMILTSFSEDWAFSLEKDGKKLFIVSHHFPLNPASVSELCRDKALTFEVLSSCGIPAAEHVFLPNTSYSAYQGQASTEEQAREYLKKHGRIVLKDNYGTGGNRVFFAADEEALYEAVKELLSRTAALSLSPYYEIEAEYRAVVLDGTVRLVFSKERPYVLSDGKSTVRELLQGALENVGSEAALKNRMTEEDPERTPEAGTKVFLNWKHNLGQGAIARVLQEDETKSELSRLAIRAANALNVRFASVDMIRTEDSLMVLEVNSGVMMEHFAAQTEESYQAAKEIYKDAVRAYLTSLKS